MDSYAIGIGILAYNEQDDIADTLKSLFQQSVFTNPILGDACRISSIEIIVVPNGCTDDTTGAAKAALERLKQDFINPGAAELSLDCQVRDIQMAGKSNAWNVYIHQFSSDDLDLFVMVDADIEFNEVDTISNSLKAILADKTAKIVVDTPLKSIFKKKDKSLLDRISLRVSREHLDRRVAVAGSFYCSWTKTLRQIWMPAGLPAEDAFLKSMIVTDMFRTPLDNNKIIRAENASHFYDSETSLNGILRHEIRGMIGAAINCYLTWDFLLFATDPRGPGAGVVLRHLLEKNPDWLQQFLQNTIRNKGFWILPRGTITGGFAGLRGKHPVRNFRSYLIVSLRFLINLLVGVIANHKLKKGQGIGYW